MKGSALEVDPKRYGRLLSRKLQAVIRTEEEHERLVAKLEDLDERGAGRQRLGLALFLAAHARQRFSSAGEPILQRCIRPAGAFCE